jgi:hypothetical protein
MTQTPKIKSTLIKKNLWRRKKLKKIRKQWLQRKEKFVRQKFAKLIWITTCRNNYLKILKIHKFQNLLVIRECLNILQKNSATLWMSLNLIKSMLSLMLLSINQHFRIFATVLLIMNFIRFILCSSLFLKDI